MAEQRHRRLAVEEAQFLHLLQEVAAVRLLLLAAEAEPLSQGEAVGSRQAAAVAHSGSP